MFLGERFFKVSNAMFCYGLTPVQFTVYSYLLCCAGNKEKCWPSIQTIAENCNCSATTARAAVHELARRGFIRCVHTYETRRGRNRQTNNTYYIQPLPPLPKEGDDKPVYHEEEVSA